MRKNHLRLVVSNDTVKKNIAERIYDWFCKPRQLPFVIGYEEKKEVIRDYLTLRFADYQLAANDVGLFPLCEAINEVAKLERDNQIDKYYRIVKRKMGRA